MMSNDWLKSSDPPTCHTYKINFSSCMPFSDRICSILNLWLPGIKINSLRIILKLLKSSCLSSFQYSYTYINNKLNLPIYLKILFDSIKTDFLQTKNSRNTQFLRYIKHFNSDYNTMCSESNKIDTKCSSENTKRLNFLQFRKETKFFPHNQFSIFFFHSSNTKTFELSSSKYHFITKHPLFMSIRTEISSKRKFPGMLLFSKFLIKLNLKINFN